jgi:putative redox protein
MDDMSASATDFTGRRSAVSPVTDDARHHGQVDEAVYSAGGLALFVIPTRGGDGLRASIRGHLLELADPSSGHGLAPTPDDLFIASIASDLAWSACRFLRDHGLRNDVSVSAHSRTLQGSQSVTEVSMTVTVSTIVEPMSSALHDALAERVAARSLQEPVTLDLRCVG